MWYMPYLRVRHAVLVYAYIALGITLVSIALRYWPGATHFDGDRASIRVGLDMLVMAATALVGGFATVLGLNLAAENDGHLELAWTKPISREGYALGVFAVDIAAMAVCIAFTTLCAVLIVDTFAGYQAVMLGPSPNSLRAVAFLGFPLCIYGWIAALSASLKRNRGTIAGIFWPLMIVLGALQFVPVGAVHAVVGVLDLFNPVALFSSSGGVVHVSTDASSTSMVGQSPSLWTYAWGWAVAALLLAAALLQWRRLEI